MLIFVLSCLILNLNILTYIVCIFYKVCVLSLFYTCIHSLLPKYAYLSLKSNQNVSFSPIKRKLSTGSLKVCLFEKCYRQQNQTLQFFVVQSKNKTLDLIPIPTIFRFIKLFFYGKEQEDLCMVGVGRYEIYGKCNVYNVPFVGSIFENQGGLISNIYGNIYSFI